MSLTMQIIIPMAGLVMLALAVVTLLLLRSFFAGSRFHDEEEPPVLELCWRDYRPLERLLDPADFDFLRSRGVAEVRIKKLRNQRRKIYRQCLRSLAYDFNLVHRSVNLILIQSRVDRPELAKELASLKLTFYRNLVKAEFRLTLTAYGFDRMPEIDLLQPLEVLQFYLRQLAVPVPT
jgi:hypothetical protein